MKNLVSIDLLLTIDHNEIIERDLDFCLQPVSAKGRVGPEMVFSFFTSKNLIPFDKQPELLDFMTGFIYLLEGRR